MDKKIVRNYVYSAAYRVLVTIIPFITTPYVSRVLKPAGNGIYSYTSSIATVFALLAALGFGTYGQREIAYRQDDLHVRSVLFYEIMLFRAVTTLLSAAAFIAFSLFYREYTVYLLPQCMTVLSVMIDIAWYYQGMEDFRITVIRGLVVKLVSVACIFLFVKTQDDLCLYIVILSASMLLSNLFYFVNLHKHVERVKPSELQPLRHVRGTIEFFIPLIAVEIYSHLDRIMLGYFIPTAVESGYYEQARKITTIIVGFIISINNVMMSRISNLYAKQKKDSILEFYRRTFRIVLLLMVPICVGLLLVSDNFALWFFGTEYGKVASLMKLSSLLILFMCVGNFIGIQYLSPTGQQNRMTKAYVIAALCNIGLNALMIPSLASVGAMTASIIAESISCGLQVYWLMRSEYRFNLLGGAWRYAAATLGMAAVILALHFAMPLKGVAQTAADVALGGFAYFALLLAMREENITAIWRRLARRA